MFDRPRAGTRVLAARFADQFDSVVVMAIAEMSASTMPRRPSEGCMGDLGAIDHVDIVLPTGGAGRASHLGEPATQSGQLESIGDLHCVEMVGVAVRQSRSGHE